jgi:hypothetical protein
VGRGWKPARKTEREEVCKEEEEEVVVSMCGDTLKPATTREHKSIDTGLIDVGMHCCSRGLT